jgi:hypothetical protein
MSVMDSVRRSCCGRRLSTAFIDKYPFGGIGTGGAIIAGWLAADKSLCFGFSAGVSGMADGLPEKFPATARKIDLAGAMRRQCLAAKPYIERAGQRFANENFK